MTRELIKSYTKKDFKVDWFSGTGAGGQHRNKHQNCCRITHIESGIRTQCTSHKSRASNQSEAFKKLARILTAHYSVSEERDISTAVIRHYHAERNVVKDVASGLEQSYKSVVTSANIGDMIDARRLAVSVETSDDEQEPS